MQNNSSPPNYPSTNQNYEYIQQNLQVSAMTSLFAAETHSAVTCQTPTQIYVVENFSGPPRDQVNDTSIHNLCSLTNSNMPLTTSLNPHEENNNISHDNSLNRPSFTPQGHSYYTQQLNIDSSNNTQYNTAHDNLKALIDYLNLDEYGNVVEPATDENHQVNPELNSDMQPQSCNFGDNGNPLAPARTLTTILPTQQQSPSNYSYVTDQYSDTAITNGNTTTARRCSLINADMPLTTPLRPNEQSNNISHDNSYELSHHQQQEIFSNRPSSTQQGPSYYTQQLNTDSSNNTQYNTAHDELMALIDDLNLAEYGNVVEPATDENHQVNPQINSNMQPQICILGESRNPVAATNNLTAILPTQQQSVSNYSCASGQYSDTDITNGNTPTARKCDPSSGTSSSLDDNCIKLPNGQIKCILCEKKFSRLCYFKQHYKSQHNGECPHRCEACGKRFQFEKVFTEHKSKHGSKDKKHKCDICPKQYHYKADLKRHINTEHCGRVFTCEICKKRYTRRDHLLKHQKTHNK